jgi:hypothetical protein
MASIRTKRIWFTEQRIRQIVALGAASPDLRTFCRHLGINLQIYYAWKARYRRPRDIAPLKVRGG